MERIYRKSKKQVDRKIHRVRVQEIQSRRRRLQWHTAYRQKGAFYRNNGSCTPGYRRNKGIAFSVAVIIVRQPQNCYSQYSESACNIISSPQSGSARPRLLLLPGRSRSFPLLEGDWAVHQVEGGRDSRRMGMTLWRWRVSGGKTGTVPESGNIVCLIV